MILTFHLFPKPVYFGTECAPPPPPLFQHMIMASLAPHMSTDSLLCFLMGRISRAISWAGILDDEQDDAPHVKMLIYTLLIVQKPKTWTVRPPKL